MNEQLNISNEENNEVYAAQRGTLGEPEELNNVLSSRQVMTLFLDAEQRIHRFTPAVTELFPILPGDKGRQITELTPKFRDKRFLDDVRAVILIGEPLEGTAHHSDGRLYLRQVRPFHTEDQSTGRVCITFEEIKALKYAEDAQRKSREELAGEATALARHNEMSLRLWQSRDLASGLQAILEATIALLRGDIGNAQLLNPKTPMLAILNQRGCHHDFLELFIREVSVNDDSVCDRNFRLGTQAIVEGAETEANHAPLRNVTVKAGYRAATSTGILNRSCATFGILSGPYDVPPSTEPVIKLVL